MISITVNCRKLQLDVEPDTQLVSVLRDRLGLTGTKYGCGLTVCGACIVHLEGEPVRSCDTTIGAAAGKRITTIEGIGASKIGRALRDAWIALDVPQCEYCESGQIMNIAAFLAKNASPSEEQIAAALDDIVCHCSPNVPARAAVRRAAQFVQP